MPNAVRRVLSLVRRLIDYGKELAGTLQQRAAAPQFVRFVRPLGAADLASILARITNGLRRAAALEARLCQRAARGQDLAVASVRLPAVRAPRAERQVAPPDAQPEPQRADPTEDQRLVRLLTEEEIAAEVRRRPVGAVIADICHDLGIAPGHLDRAFWDEITRAIIFYGGSLLGFVRDPGGRWVAYRSGDAAWHVVPPRLPAPATTGPP